MSNTAQAAHAGPVLLESRQDGIATLVLNRPDKLNALNSELSTALNDALARIADDEFDSCRRTERRGARLLRGRRSGRHRQRARTQ